MVLHGNAHLWPQAEPIQQMQQIETFPSRGGFFRGIGGGLTPLVNTCGGENLEKAGKPKKTTQKRSVVLGRGVKSENCGVFLWFPKNPDIS